MRRSIGTIALAALVLVGLAACVPPPPPPELHVTTTDDGADANPGDGICETAPGNGVCTLTAAVQEGNALGEAVITVPTVEDLDAMPPLTETTITGRLTLRSGHVSDNGAVTAAPQTLTIAPGGQLTLESFTLYVYDGLRNEGAFLVNRSGLAAEVTNEVGARMVVVNSMVVAPDLVPGPLVTNRGTLLVRYANLDNGGPVLHTEPGATSTIGASVLYSYTATESCTGAPPHSDGYNDTDGGGLDEDQCPLGGPPGKQFAPDEIPSGVLGCGTDITIDWDGNARPIDSNADGTSGCEVGPVELLHSPHSP